jgi:hypothetical protein
LLGNLHPRYATLLGRNDFKDPLLRLGGRLSRELRGTPVGDELERLVRGLKAQD